MGQSKLPKRQRLLADVMVAHPESESSMAGRPIQYHESVRRTLPRARRFVLDEKATLYVEQLVNTAPVELYQNREFAVQPYDVMWVETATIPGRDLYRSAFLFDRGVIYFVAEQPAQRAVVGRDGSILRYEQSGETGGGALPFSIQINDAPTRALFDALAMLDDAEREDGDAERPGSSAIATMMWGPLAKHVPAKTLINDNSVAVGFAFTREEMLADRDLLRRVMNSMKATSGFVLFSLAMLLMLNRPKVSRFTDVPSARAFVGNKVRPFMSHTSVTIDIASRDYVRDLDLKRTIPGTPKRRHEVRGHWCQNEESRNRFCEHVWREPKEGEYAPWRDAEREPRRYVCERCGGKRWWRYTHLRGDGSIGFVSNDYNVTAGAK